MKSRRCDKTLNFLWTWHFRGIKWKSCRKNVCEYFSWKCREWKFHACNQKSQPYDRLRSSSCSKNHGKSVKIDFFIFIHWKIIFCCGRQNEVEIFPSTLRMLSSHIFSSVYKCVWYESEENLRINFHSSWMWISTDDDVVLYKYKEKRKEKKNQKKIWDWKLKTFPFFSIDIRFVFGGEKVYSVLSVEH